MCAHARVCVSASVSCPHTLTRTHAPDCVQLLALLARLSFISQSAASLESSSSVQNPLLFLLNSIILQRQFILVQLYSHHSRLFSYVLCPIPAPCMTRLSHGESARCSGGECTMSGFMVMSLAAFTASCNSWSGLKSFNEVANQQAEQRTCMEWS